MINVVLKKIFGSKNDREIKRMRPLVGQINAFEPTVSLRTDQQLGAKTDEFRKRLADGAPGCRWTYSIVSRSSAVLCSSATVKGSIRRNVTIRSRWTGSSASFTFSLARDAEPLAISIANSATRGTSSSESTELATKPQAP